MAVTPQDFLFNPRAMLDHARVFPRPHDGPVSRVPIIEKQIDSTPARKMPKSYKSALTYGAGVEFVLFAQQQKKKLLYGIDREFSFQHHVDGMMNDRGIKFLPMDNTKCSDSTGSFVWMELHGVHSLDGGYLHGCADIIILETVDDYILFDREKLLKYITTKIDVNDPPVTSVKEALYRVYRLPSRYFMRTLVRVDDLLHSEAFLGVWKRV